MAETAEEALAPPAAPEADAAESPQAQEPAGSVEQGESDEEYDEGSSAEEESGEEEEEEESSGDEDEKQPLSQRSAYASKHPLPQPTAPKRTRTNRFPKIPKSQRCGTCENCMNPQRKKACIVARQRMEEQMRLKEQQQGNGSSSKSGGGGSRSGKSTAAAPGPDPSDDPFTAALSKILSSTGGVQQERHVPLLLQLVRRARSKAHRTALLVVLQRSAGEVQRQAVAGKLLLELQSWLTDAVDEGDAKRAQNCLACLDKLPVTLAALQPPCELGKVVGKLRKHDSFGAAITDTAKRLVARWKGVVEAAQAKKAAGTAGGSTASATAAAKPAAAAAAKPAAAAAAAAKPAATKPAAAGAAANERQASGSLAGMADGDLFKSADRQRAGVRDAVPAVKKTVIKTLPVEASRAKLSESAAAEREGGSGGKPGSSASAASDVSKVSASPFASLGGLSGGVTMLGGSSSSGPLGSLSLSTVGPSSNSARDRALAAARRVPSPEPQPKKEKAKKVSWQKEDALVGVRWFLKADPPAAAQADADPAQLQRSTSDAAREPSPPGFESAAKKEHLSEAAALRQHRAEEDQERADLEERLAHMVATTAWLNPQPNDDLSDAQLAAMAAPPAYGEDSTEAPAAAARSQQVPRAQYASPAAIPETPGEPTSVADHGVVQHPATIPRIPLSLEEAAAMQPQQAQQQQAQQQQQQQQQPPMQQPPMQQPGPQPMFRQQAPTAQQQQQQQQQQGQPAAALPDISAALAQLAASGVLSSVPGGGPPQRQQPPPMQQQQQPYPGPPGMPPQGPHMRPPPPPMGGMRPPPPGGPPQQGWQQPGPPRPQMQQPGPPRPQMQQPAPPRPPMQQPGPPMQGPPMQQQQRGFGAPGPRPCRYFNTPRGCFQGDRCNFAHVPLGAENGRGPGPAAGMKRPAESDAGRQGKQPRWQ